MDLWGVGVHVLPVGLGQQKGKEGILGGGLVGFGFFFLRGYSFWLGEFGPFLHLRIAMALEPRIF